jgi:adenosylcobinamide-GDP ribazoletransferase
MPAIRWERESMEYTFACLPLVGVVLGASLWLWLRLCLLFGIGALLRGAGAVALSAALTGGIHLDGLCDTCDALGSHQSRERRLEILKDPHIGAFGVLGCVLFLLGQFAGWAEIPLTGHAMLLAALIPVTSRSWVALGALTRPNARGSGLLATFQHSSSLGVNRAAAVLWTVANSAALVLLGGAGPWMALSALLCYGYTLWRTEKDFGGLTGDLAGWTLCLLELCQVITLAVEERGAFP